MPATHTASFSKSASLLQKLKWEIWELFNIWRRRRLRNDKLMEKTNWYKEDLKRKIELKPMAEWIDTRVSYYLTIYKIEFPWFNLPISSVLFQGGKCKLWPIWIWSRPTHDFTRPLFDKSGLRSSFSVSNFGSCPI